MLDRGIPIADALRRMSKPTLFLTGASGFVGRSLLGQLADPSRARCLARDPARLPAGTAVHGDLCEPGDWENELVGCDVVVHLAALTGKARPEEYTRVNVDGTRNLVAACERAGVRRLVHVSTVAVAFPEKKHYPYARSKEEAEAVVRASNLDWAIVRPTIVLGKESPAWSSLSTLAKAPVVPLFGGGKARVQPVDVDDLARGLSELAARESLGGKTLDLGGPESCTFRELLLRMARVHGRPNPRTLALPAELMIAVLSILEPVLLPVLPLTAGQLYPFVHDTTTDEGCANDGFLDIDGMLARYTSDD